MSYSTRKLTNSTDETTISSLFSGDLVFGIPYFQRAYKWKEKNIERFESDLESLLDYEDTSHFLGAIIIFGKPTNPSDPDYFEVIDGQQRLTTCYISLIALAKTFSLHELLDDAMGLYERYLVVSRKTKNLLSNAKLICCKEDRAGMNHIFHDLTSNSEFLHMIQNVKRDYKPMPNTGAQTGRAWKNYKRICKFFESKYQENEKIEPGRGAQILRELYNKLVNSMSVVQIVVKDPTDGPKIFDSLNSKQEAMTIGDLVRNELFAKIADHDDDEIDILDRDHWHPFYERFKQNDNESFDKVFEQYFFPYVLTLNSSVKKADAFNYLRDQWSRIDDPVRIIEKLAEHQDTYLDLVYGTSLSQCDPMIKEALLRLSRMQTPTSVHPFLLQVVKANKEKQLGISNTRGILERIESFLVRRSVCGYEPTGLHALFKNLWNECESDYSVENVVDCVRQHRTVKWPDDDEFIENIKKSPLYGSRITPYLLAEWNGYLGGDIPKLDKQQIEHVLPETPHGDSQWLKDWTKKQHNQMKDCLANLLPLSGTLNASIQNAEYDVKKARYDADSALKAPREFAKRYSVWTPKEFDQRADELAKWALDRWKY